MSNPRWKQATSFRRSEKTNRDGTRCKSYRKSSPAKHPAEDSADQITLFKSNGIATWDLASAVRVYEMAVAQGLGQPIPLWQSKNKA